VLFDSSRSLIPQHKKQGSSNTMTDATEPKGLGLLRGVDVETSLTYSNELIYSEDLLSKDGVFWAAAEADALSCGKSVESYLEDIQERFKTFMRSDDVFDRTDLKKGVRALIMQQNEISIALGAKSIGKTKVFQSVVNEITTEKGDVLVVYVNARDHASGSLAKGIQLALSRLDKLDFFKKVDWGTVRQSLAEFLALTHEKAGEIATTMNNLLDAMHVCGNVEDVVDADINFVHLIIALAEQRQQHPCLIIDEANLCLPGGEREDSIINQFLHVTKEEKKMNVILCSSKHSFPNQLVASGLQLGTVNLVQAEEPPPCAVWKFLREEKNSNGGYIIGMGKKLANLCISIAGGNVFLIAKAVGRLADRKEAFKGSQLVKSIEGGLAVLDVIENPVARAALEELSKVGYATSVTGQTRLLLVEKSIAGLLTEDFTFFSDLRRIVYSFGEVLVPSSSGLRNRIALELQRAANNGEYCKGSDTSSPQKSDK
jgi:hypothetical protein